VGEPVIIEVALNGQTTPERNRTVATSIDDIVEQGLACIDAGASIVHNHLLADAGAARIGFIDPGSLILGFAEPDGTPSPNSHLYINTFADMAWAIEQAHRRAFALHFAIFEPGFLRNVFSYWRLGRLTPGSFVKFYFGGDNGYMARGKGVTFGLPPTAKALDAYLEMMAIEGCDLPWFSAVPGGDLIRTPVARATLERGGHLRVGLEDHFGDRQPSNVELVREVVREVVELCAEVGRPVATPAQSCAILGVLAARQEV
jgi:3-keto-5-aminohexanoate cleavage enzyme